MKKNNPAKEHYQRLRLLSCEDLWAVEVAAFDAADVRGRMDRVAVVRAVGVVFSESGNDSEKARAREWLHRLLSDPEEKIRRYAMNALPKLGGGFEAENALLSVLESATSDREKESVAKTLQKVGGRASLETLSASHLGTQTVRKLEANIARTSSPGTLCMHRSLEDVGGLGVVLNCRRGLEEILEEEFQGAKKAGFPFRQKARGRGYLHLVPEGPFSLGDLFKLRCFHSVGFVPEAARTSARTIVSFAQSIVNARPLLEMFTEGPVRYRLEFIARGHQRQAIRTLADQVYGLCPSLLNDSRNALWQVNVFPDHYPAALEISPRLRPDPRFAYRQGDVPAASHPPLAACMARLAGLHEADSVWDPFCGSGLELIERSLRGGVKSVLGTDRSSQALESARKNFDAAGLDHISSNFLCSDFRDAEKVQNAFSLVMTNPPMGRRVPIPDLEQLIADFFVSASKALKPGGRLVFVNPLTVAPRSRDLELLSRQKIDMGGFHAHLEKYIKRKN